MLGVVDMRQLLLSSPPILRGLIFLLFMVDFALQKADFKKKNHIKCQTLAKLPFSMNVKELISNVPKNAGH